MNNNKIEKKVVIHIDDIGSSIGANKAAFDLLSNGYASSGSIMAPCHGFEDALNYIKNNPLLDIGLHLTLTSERNKKYNKWKPTLPSGKVSSLTDKDGYFLSTIDEVFNQANPEEIKSELINQFIITKNAGLSISHIDSHMGVLLHKKFFHIYQELAEILNIQPFICKSKIGDTQGNRFYDCDKYIQELEHKGFKKIDYYDDNTLYENERNHENFSNKRIESINIGTTYFLLHVLDNNLNIDDETPDYIARQLEYNFFKSIKTDNLFKKLNIKKITMKDLKNI